MITIADARMQIILSTIKQDNGLPPNDMTEEEVVCCREAGLVVIDESVRLSHAYTVPLDYEIREEEVQWYPPIVGLTRKGDVVLKHLTKKLYGPYWQLFY